jgi:hypothetical protein
MPADSAEPYPSNDPEEAGIWELRIGIHATARQAEELKTRIQRLLCPDPDHAPPCEIPWTTSLLEGGDLEVPDAYEELTTQAHIERALRGNA